MLAQEAALSLEAKWIWHPQWKEPVNGTAGQFVYFKKCFDVIDALPQNLSIFISADTKYKLYVNAKLVLFGPVKGDQYQWYFDEVNLQPHLRVGRNEIIVRVLRFYHATPFAVSFPRLGSPGLFVHQSSHHSTSRFQLDTNTTWSTLIDTTTVLPTDQEEDDFLHVYENVDNRIQTAGSWVSARLLDFPRSHGLTPPWKLSLRTIPYAKSAPAYFSALHNIKSSIPRADWEHLLLPGNNKPASLCLIKGSMHRLELQATEHLTAFVDFIFVRPKASGSKLTITYSECYEDQPAQVPYLRKKNDRRDTSKSLLGPKDKFVFGGIVAIDATQGIFASTREENFRPFHFRTFRFMTLEIEVAEDSDLELMGIDLRKTHYPLEVRATVSCPALEDAELYQQLWSVSLRTLTNCIHDCYEDCPFYEQLQYAMDTRSSILFMYSISNDDRLAKQAIMQLHNSYQPSLGLTASRAPSHGLQVIPHFSLFWIITICDHFQYFGEKEFVRQFLPVCNGILNTFAKQVDSETGLIRYSSSSPHWDFVDWTDSWRPFGIPPAAARTGYLSYTSMLYAYTLKHMVRLLEGVGKDAYAQDLQTEATLIISAIKLHCYDGEFFTDGLASEEEKGQGYSENAQIWGVLSGALEEEQAAKLLRRSLRIGPPSRDSGFEEQSKQFAPVSVAMSFYKLRALSAVKGNIYDDAFHQFWDPWKAHLANNLTTWEEDTVSQRSDCHAWGCAALYEFTAEVAGVRPAAPGWSVIKFSPRIKLFSEFNAQVPCWGKSFAGVAHVRWLRLQDNRVKVTLELESESSDPITNNALPSIQVELPGSDIELVCGQRRIERVVTL